MTVKTAQLHVENSCYCVPMTQNEEWALEMAHTVATEIKRLRNAKTPKWSLKRLSEETEKLGYPIGQSVLSNLEYGRRGARLDVAELLVIAAALEVPPARLLWPKYPDGWANYLPSRVETALRADWLFTGRLVLNPDLDDPIFGKPEPLVALVEARERLYETDEALKELDGKTDHSWLLEQAGEVARRANELNNEIRNSGGVVRRG